MIEQLPGWSWELHNTGILLRPHDGSAGAEIRYVERFRPLAHVSALVDAAPEVAGWREQGRTPIERFVTDEGEHAAAVTLHGAIDGAQALRAFAFVLADDFVARVMGLARDPRDFARVTGCVRQLAQRDTHALGVRRRRFVHAAPDGGWHGFALPPFHATWIPLDYPADPSSIGVFPAIPGAAEGVLEALIDGVTGGVRAAAPTPLTVAEGLSGAWHAVEDAARTWDIVLCADDRYAYPLILTSTPARRSRHLSSFLAVARSVEPVPRSRATRVAVDPSLTHWSE